MKLDTSALGAYLQAVRERLPNMSRAKLAAKVDSTENTIWRIESGRQEPSSRLLAHIVRVLGARWADVERLLVDKEATETDARALAERWMSTLDPDARAAFEARVDATPVSERERIAAELRRLAEDIAEGRVAPP